MFCVHQVSDKKQSIESDLKYYENLVAYSRVRAILVALEKRLGVSLTPAESNSVHVNASQRPINQWMQGEDRAPVSSSTKFSKFNNTKPRQNLECGWNAEGNLTTLASSELSRD